MTKTDTIILCFLYVLGGTILGYGIDIGQTTWIACGASIIFIATMWPIIRGMEGL